MASIGSTGFSIAGMLQDLTSSAPQLSSTLSSSTIQTALQSALPSDLLQLSSQALQLEETALLFGDPAATAAPAIPAALNPLAALDPNSSASSSSATLASQLSAYQNATQSQDIQTLFGITPESPPSSSTLI